ncbi:hypothetical protein CK203_062926 [Vitis vinifera]|uniref:DUF4216 domain-containing protein n=1 Tax=Vitis vinifera TaxID=29760 RepID=A0A438FSW3_VITVI|nr:hypothetical protein CK203_062926 [Vitis vinifera]
MLQLLGDMLPLNNEMPLSMYEAKKTFSALGMEYQKIHACPNDCILYRNQYKDAIACPTCGKSRWKINNEGGKIKKGVPAKVLWYFPPIPRFKRMFQSSETAKHLMWHAKDKECDGKLRHPSDSSAWKLVDHMWPDFASEPRNLRLALSTDGPRQPGKNIDVYLSPLVDDLKTLWEKGVETYDAHLRKTKDGLNARLDLVEMGLRNLVSLEELKLFGLKSHDYHALMQQLLPVALRSVLPKHEHMNWLKSQYPRQSKRQIWLQEEHMRCFTYWLKGKVEEAIHNGKIFPTRLDGDMGSDYNMFRIPIFKCDWVDNKNGIKVDELGFTLVDFSKIGHKSDPFILASQAQQVFYVEDQLDPKLSIVLSIPPKDFNNMEGLDDFTDNCMEHHPFISSMPEVESFDVMDESEAIYMREDCEGIWIENN